jgi:RHS repeat-associated protein
MVAELNAQGDVVSRSVSGLAPYTFDFDVRGRVEAVHQGTRTWTMGYDAFGRVASITDPLSRVTLQEFDAAGRVIRRVLPGGREILFGRNNVGWLEGITPPGKPEHTFSYTPLGLAASYTAPAVSGPTSNTTSQAYNLDRQMTTQTKPDGSVLTWTYFVSGKLDRVAGPTDYVDHTYDAETGQLIALSDADTTLTVTYDGMLPTTTTIAGPLSGASVAVTTARDADFRVISEQVGSSAAIAYAYDNDNLMTAAGDLIRTPSTTNGLLEQTVLTAGSFTVTETLERNVYGEVHASTYSWGAFAAAFDYSRDAIGRIAQIDESGLIGTRSRVFGYDPAGRLETVDVDGVRDVSYTYDDNGNRLSETRGAVTTLASYDDQDRLLAYDDNEYSYTANGELSSVYDGSNFTTFTYDDFSNLVEVDLPNASVIRYYYDAQHRRVARTLDGTLTHRFVYSTQLRIVAEADLLGNITTRYVYADKANVPEYMIRNGITYRFLHDHLGSVRAVVNMTTGVIAQSMRYDAFGAVLADTNPGFQPFGYAGGLYDAATGLVRFGARDYNPAVGRWTTKDPLLFNGGLLNLYGGTDPVNFVDPTGTTIVIQSYSDQVALQQLARNVPGARELINFLNGPEFLVILNAEQFNAARASEIDAAGGGLTACGSRNCAIGINPSLTDSMGLGYESALLHELSHAADYYTLGAMQDEYNPNAYQSYAESSSILDDQSHECVLRGTSAANLCF